MEKTSDEESHIYSINVHLATLRCLRPMFPISDVVVSVTFANDVLFESERILMAENLVLGQDILLQLNLGNTEMMSKYVTNPIIFSIREYECKPIEEVKIHSVGKERQSLWRSEESVLDLEEALYGTRTDVKNAKKTKDQAVVKEKTKRVSTPSMKSIEPSEKKGPQEAGVASVDLMSLFLDKTCIMEDLVLKVPAGKPLDDRIRSHTQLPILQVEISIDRPLPTSTMIYATVESIYNIPAVMQSDMIYQLALFIPRCTTIESAVRICFENPQFMNVPHEKFTFKKYFGSNEFSKFILRDDFTDVKSGFTLELDKALPVDFPRIQFNTIRGEILSADDVNSFKSQLVKYRCFGIELFIKRTTTATRKAPKTKLTGKKVDKVSKKSTGTATTDENTSVAVESEYLHMMGFLDLCQLLCPGRKSTRVACHLKTFNQEEFEAECGLKDSYFQPAIVAVKEDISVKSEVSKSAKYVKKTEKRSKATKSSKGTKTTKTGTRSKEKADRGHDLLSKLPTPASPPIPSQLVFNEDGYPCFLIVEFELREALVKPHQVEDLQHRLEDIIANLPSITKIGLCSNKDTKEEFKNVVRTIMDDLRAEYREYFITSNGESSIESFMNYLHKQEAYSRYIIALTKSASCYCNVTKNLVPFNNLSEYQQYLGEAYIDLIQLIHKVLNSSDFTNLKPTSREETRTDDLLFFAKEATALRATALASRYYLKRIASNDKDARCWLDYASFKLEIQDTDAAFECAIEAIRNDYTNRDALIMFACLQARQMKYAEAETCLLNVTINHPRWIVGWMALYCVYTRSKNYEGMELCIETASKYYAEDIETLNVNDDLQWLPKILPEKFTFRSIVYLLKHRLIAEAEIVLAIEACRLDTDLLQYILAFIEHIRGEYDHALDHIDASFRLGPCSPAKNALRGHIYAQMGKIECALSEYELVLAAGLQEEFGPATYFLHLRAALCYSANGQNAVAKSLLMTACQQMGSPYAWLTAGVLYYQEGENKIAEDCFTIGNTMDNCLPEIWAYLALLNIEFGKLDEASICYKQALKNQLQNEDLILLINVKLQECERNVFCHGK